MGYEYGPYGIIPYWWFPLRDLWILVGALTVVFCIRAMCSILPRPHQLRSWATGLAALVTAAGLVLSLSAFSYTHHSPVTCQPTKPVTDLRKLPDYDGQPVQVLDNDQSRGSVTLTFDDGPGKDTPTVLRELQALHTRVVFFDIGYKVEQSPTEVCQEKADGDVVGVHTFDHRSLTGYSTHSPPLTDKQVTAELSSTKNLIEQAGGGTPRLWRPPYGDVSWRDVGLARQQGLRVVMDSGSGIVESDDWNGLAPDQIYQRIINSNIRNGTIIAFHDGLPTAPSTIAALPMLVRFLNASHLGVTVHVRPDATGAAIGNKGGGASE
jgi:peptidoglycan-N-acetylglucosamine deacetylase